LACLAVACGDPEPSDPVPEAGTSPDLGLDAGALDVDGGSPDDAADGGRSNGDAAPAEDAGAPVDGGPSADAEPGTDGGPGVDAGSSDAARPDGASRDVGPSLDAGAAGDAGASDATAPADVGAPLDLGPGDAARMDGSLEDMGGGTTRDAGSPDSAVPPDTGGPTLPDAGAPDGSAPPDLGAADSGATPSDAGAPDGGLSGGGDAGRPDGGGGGDVGATDAALPDAGPGFDAGATDGALPDAGAGLDAGTTDGGPPDAGGGLDAGTTDGGPPDAGAGLDGGGADAGSPDQGFVNTGPLPCTSNGWCWDNPVPQFGDYLGAWTDGQEGWLVGEQGLAVRFDGQRWRRIPTGTTEDLEAVWGASSTDVWIAGGDDVILRWNGRTLSAVSSPVRRPRPVSIHGSAANDVWIIGAAALRWDGTRLQSHTSGVGLNDVFVRGPSAAYGVDDNGRVLVWDGRTWTSTTSGTRNDLHTVFGTASEVWAAGERGTVIRDSGSGFRAGPSIGSTFEATDLWMSSPTDVYVATDRVGPLVRYDGTRWQVPFTRADRPLSAVYGRSASDVWVAGVSAFFAEYDGTTWADGNAQRPVRAFARTSTAAGATLFAAGLDDLLMRRDPSGWTSSLRTFRRGRHFWGGFTGHGISWLLGENGKILSWNGTSWSSVRGFTSNALRDAWASGPNAVWAVGDSGSQAFWNGSTWTRPSPGTSVSLRATWGSGANDVWSVGERAVITRWNGTRLSITQVGNRGRVYEDIEGRSATDVWVVGHEPASPVRDGVVLRWDGMRWRTVRTEPRAELRCVLLTGSSEVWVGTDDGRILRYDGSTWTTSFSNPSFITIWDLTEDASGRIWAATEGGGILYLDP
jgi:hypothetical protein